MTVDHKRGLLIALAGVLVLSPDTLFVRLTGMDSWMLAFWRGMGIVLTMSAIMWWQLGRAGMVQQFKGLGMNGIIAGCCFSTSNVTFLVALDHTAVANVLALLALTPILGAVLSRFILGEAFALHTLCALVGCIIGVTVILGGDIDVGSDHLFGDVMAMLAALAQGLGFVMLRRNGENGQLPALILGGSLTFVVGAIMSPMVLMPEMGAGAITSLIVVAFLVIPVSFSLIGLALRYIPVAEVSMLMLLEMVLGPLLVWALLAELVPLSTLIGGVVLFVTLSLHAIWPLYQKRLID